jgi:anti-anti-sigma regulatory factor
VSDAWLSVDPVTGVVCPFGEYDISSDRYSVGDDLRFALRADGNQPVLDLSGLQFADTCLVNVLAEAALDGISVNVKNPPPIVRRSLDLTGVSDLVELD